MTKKIITLILLSCIVVLIFIFKNSVSKNSVQPLFDQIEGVEVHQQSDETIFKTQDSSCKVTHTYTKNSLKIEHSNGCESFLENILNLNKTLLKRAKTQSHHLKVAEVILPSLFQMSLLTSNTKEKIVKSEISNKKDFLDFIAQNDLLTPMIELLKSYELPSKVTKCGPLMLKKTNSNQIIFYDSQFFILK